MRAFCVGDKVWAIPLKSGQHVQPLCIGGWAIWLSINKWSASLPHPYEYYKETTSGWFTSAPRQALELTDSEVVWLCLPPHEDLCEITPKRAAKNIRALCRNPSIVESQRWLP